LRRQLSRGVSRTRHHSSIFVSRSRSAAAAPKDSRNASNDLVTVVLGPAILRTYAPLGSSIQTFATRQPDIGRDLPRTGGPTGWRKVPVRSISVYSRPALDVPLRIVPSRSFSSNCPTQRATFASSPPTPPAK